MKFITLFAFLINTSVCVSSQNLIGLNDKEIIKYMKENQRDMRLENVTNTRYNYLKYSNSSDDQTLLFFLNTDSVCKSVRMICNFSIMAQKVKEFDSIYTKRGENRWIDTQNGKDYLIEIQEEKWTYIINIEPYK